MDCSKWIFGLCECNWSKLPVDNELPDEVDEFEALVGVGCEISLTTINSLVVRLTSPGTGTVGFDVQVSQVLFLRRCCRNNQEDRKKHRLFFLWEGIDQIFRQTSRTPSTKPWWNTTRVTALVGMLLAMHIATWLIRQGGFIPVKDMDTLGLFNPCKTIWLQL